MWFRRARQEAEAPVHPGEPSALHGLAAVCAMEALASRALIVQSDPGLAELSGPLHKLLPAAASPGHVRHIATLDRIPGLATGLAATGLRCGILLSELAGLREALQAMAGKRLPCVIHLAGRATRRQAGALHGGHDDYYAVADSGLFQLFASNAQETADFSLIAHRVAELSLTPGLCAQDYYGTSQSVQNLLLPDRHLADAYLGSEADSIETPTPAQEILFGETRRRIPRLLDPDQPAGIGGIQDRDSFQAAAAAQGPFFAAHVDAIITRAMDEFGQMTGRHYRKLQAYRTDDADFVLLAMGAVVEKLAAVVDYLRSEEKIRVGLVNVSVWRPFPGAELSHLLAGKHAIAVLERSDALLADDGPLAREVRGAIDRAAENATAEADRPVWPEFATYRRAGDRPQLYCGSYGIGTDIPSFEALCAVVRNMLPEGEGRRRFYAGLQFERDRHSLPQLALVQQRLQQAYPELRALSLPETPLSTEPRLADAIGLHSLALQGGLFAGNLFARALHGSLGESLRTFPQGGLEPNLQPVRFTLVHGDGDCRTCPPQVATLLVSAQGLLESVAQDAIREGGRLVVVSGDTPKALWRSLPRRTERWIRERGIRLFTLDAHRIATDVAAHISFVEQLEIWALFGAATRIEELDGAANDGFDAALRTLLETLFGDTDPVVDEVIHCIRQGRGEVTELDWQSLPREERPAEVERAAPWTVRLAQEGQETLFDRSRFWYSVGFLYDSGRVSETAVDPFLATAVMPAGSSAHRDMKPYRLRLPQWLAENCSGCGLCWSLCPDSALPATIQRVEDVVDSAMAECKAEGAAMTQMARIAGHLAKKAHRITAKDDLRQYRDAGALLERAFTDLADGMELDDDTRSALGADFERLQEKIDGWPIARTERFFAAAEAGGKGRGRLLSIALNTVSCKACGLCIEVCPEGAFDWARQTEERLAADHRNWVFQMGLPAVPADLIAASIDESDVDSEMNRLLDLPVYHSLVGGDGAFPGNGRKTALHLVTAAVESVMQQRYREHAARLQELIDGLRAKIQGEITGVVQINDFEEFAARLSRLGVDELTPETLGSLFDSKESPRQVDEVELARLSGLLAELEAQRRAYSETGRTRMVLALDDGDVIRWSGTWPDNPHTSPWLSHSRGDGTGLAAGLAEGIVGRLGRELASCRLAELELENRFRPAEHQRLRDELDWDGLTAEERGLIPPILLVGESANLRWQDLDRLLDGSLPIIALILDRDGITIDVADEASGAEDYTRLALEEGNSFVLQATIGNPGHLIRGVVECLAAPRPALLRVLAPDPQANGIAPHRIAEQARRACESRAVPVFRFDPMAADAPLSLAGNLDPRNTWATQELTVKDASDEERRLTRELTVADWAIREARFRQHFSVTSRGRISDDMTALSEFLRLPPGERAGLTPYIDVVDDAGHHCAAALSPAMADAAERCRQRWYRLQQRAGLRVEEEPERPADMTAAPRSVAAEAPAPAVALDADTQEQLTARLLELCGFTTDPEFFTRSLRQFVVEGEKPGGEATADE